MRRELLISVFLLIVSMASAQETTKWGVSTNVPMDLALLSPNLQGSFYFNRSSVISIGGSYGWWGFNWKQKQALQQWSVNIDYNHYLKTDATYKGHHVGASLQTGQYDRKRSESARRGQISTVGITYGYTWKLNNRFYIDAGAGVGYLYRFFHNYTPTEHCEYHCLSHEAKHRFSLTNFNVSIIYRFKNNNEK